MITLFVLMRQGEDLVSSEIAGFLDRELANKVQRHLEVTKKRPTYWIDYKQIPDPA